VLRWEDVECECVSVSCCGHVHNHCVHVKRGHHVNDHDSPLASVAATNASASENGYLRQAVESESENENSYVMTPEELRQSVSGYG